MQRLTLRLRSAKYSPDLTAKKEEKRRRSVIDVSDRIALFSILHGKRNFIGNVETRPEYVHTNSVYKSIKNK